MPADERAPRASALANPDLLQLEEVRVVGRITASSNGAHLVELVSSGALAIYKPDAFERPLWDFPPGLARRELAFRLLADALDLPVVPPVVVREDLPYGPGSLQAFVEARFELTYFEMLGEPRHHHLLRAIAALDVVANNADRKASHILVDVDQHLWAIDNALSFHPEPKLRTVIWDFEGEPIDAALRARLGTLAQCVPDTLSSLLEEDELAALRRRASALARRGELPRTPEGRRPYPWPLV